MNQILLKQHAEEAVQATNRVELRYFEKLNSLYTGTKSILNKELIAFGELNPTILNIAQPVNKAEREMLISDIEAFEFERGDTELQKDLNAYKNKPFISKQDALFINLTLAYAKLGNKEQTGMYSVIGNAYTDRYFRTAFGVSLDRGWSAPIKPISNTRIQAVLKSKWKGNDLSSGIWYNKKVAADATKQQVILGLKQGKGTKDIAKAIANQLDSSKVASERLVRTYMTAITTEAEMQSYDDLGIKEYTYIATLDEKTSEQCQTLDGQKFPLSEMQPGINAPPMHPNCRSTTISAETGIQARRAKDAFANTFIVPPNTTYSQYAEQLAEETKWQGYSEQINSFIQL